MSPVLGFCNGRAPTSGWPSAAARMRTTGITSDDPFKSSRVPPRDRDHAGNFRTRAAILTSGEGLRNIARVFVNPRFKRRTVAPTVFRIEPFGQMVEGLSSRADGSCTFKIGFNERGAKVCRFGGVDTTSFAATARPKCGLDMTCSHGFPCAITGACFSPRHCFRSTNFFMIATACWRR